MDTSASGDNPHGSGFRNDPPESEDCYRHLFETLPQGIVVQDAEGRITAANAAAERILGLASGEMLGLTLLDARWSPVREDGTPFTAEDHPTMLALATGREVRGVVMGFFDSRRGERVWIRLGAVPRLDPGHERPGSVYASFEDITAARAAERTLREREEVYRAIVEDASDSIVLVDAASLRFVEFNRAAHTGLGYTREEFAALSVPDIQAEYTPGEVRARVDALARGEAPTVFENRHRCKDGQLQNVLIARSPATIQGRAYVSAIWRDVTGQKQFEQTLMASEAALKEAQAMARLGNWALDVPADRLSGSDEACRLFGVPAGASLSLEDFFGIVHPEDVEGVVERWNAAMYGAPLDTEHRIVAPAGVRWIRMRADFRRDAGGFAAFATGTVQDVTERRQAEEALRTNEKILRQMLEASPLPMLLSEGVEQRVVLLNRRFTETFGYSAQEIPEMAQWFPRAYPDEDYRSEISREWEQRLQVSIVSGRPIVPLESRAACRNGSERHVEIHAAAVGGVTIVIFHDLTQRKQTAQELERYRHHLEDLVAERTVDLEAANQRLRVSDNRLQAMFAISQRANLLDERELLQLGLEEAARLTGSRGGALYLVDAAGTAIQPLAWSGEAATLGGRGAAPTPPATADAWAECLQQGVPVLRNEGRRDAAGALATGARHLGVPVLEGHRVCMLLGVVDKATDYDETDMHELQLIGDDLWRVVMRRRAELALARAKEAAETTSRAKSMFLANMSHEIRTPMNVIIGLTHLLQRGTSDPRQGEQLRKISVAAHHLLSIINDILDISKIEEGKLMIDAEDFGLDGLLGQVCSLVSERAEQKGLELLTDIDPGLAADYRGDPLRLGQVLLNFVGNAIKFTEQGTIALRACRIGSAPDGDRVRFEVSDTGIGIAPEHQARLFEAFEQVDGSTTRRYGGTGLGLSICQRLVALMGGEIGVESRLGEGSCFWFALDLPRGTRAMPRTFPAWTPGLRILVVDDVSEARLALGNLLRGMGFGVDLAASGAEALVRLAAADSGSAPFHAVLLDRRMPGLDGIQTAVRMRALPLRKPPAYILVTASGGAVPERAGFDAVLAKPATPAALAGALRSALGGEAQTGHRPESKGLPSNAEEALLARCRGARVLLVEDDLTNQEVALELLRGVGLETDIAADGQEAVAKAREAAYGLILMDVQMPVLDGLDATRAIRALPGCEDLPILGLTADAFHEDRARCLAAGMNDHIAKPVDPEALFQAMLRWLPERDAPAAAAPESGGAAADLPVIPGVDVVRGLRNLNGRREAYLRLLRRFATSHRDDISQVRKACVEGATDAARRHCHSLKGAAGALGISEVEALAAELEGRLRDGADAGGIEACCAVCEASLRQIAAAILALPAAAGQGRPAIDWPQVRVCIERLDALLATDDMDAGAWFRETAPTLRDALGSRVDEIGRAIDGFAYDRALDALRAAAGARPELGSNDGPGAG